MAVVFGVLLLLVPLGMMPNGQMWGGGGGGMRRHLPGEPGHVQAKELPQIPCEARW